MRYKNFYDQRLDPDYAAPIHQIMYISSWDEVLKLLKWCHNRRLDFIMTPDTEYGQGWKFEIEQPGKNYMDIDSILIEIRKDSK